MLAAFDIETARWLDPVDPSGDLGITCAAIAREKENKEGIEGRAYFYTEQGLRAIPFNELFSENAPNLLSGVKIADEWSDIAAAAFVAMLDLGLEYSDICGWNSCNFDWRVLQTVSGHDCRELADNHIDLMLVFHATEGHRLSLATAAKACGTAKGYADLHTGASAPEMWREGNYLTVLRYVAQDAIATLKVAQHMRDRGGFTWQTKAGKQKEFKSSKPLDHNSTVRSIRQDWKLPASMLESPSSAWAWLAEGRQGV